MDTKSNKEDEFKFSKDELAEFKLFWEGKVGKKYRAKIERTKEQLLDAAMGTPEQDETIRYAHIANGLRSVLDDIDAIIDTANNGDKEDSTAKDTK